MFFPIPACYLTLKLCALFQQPAAKQQRGKRVAREKRKGASTRRQIDPEQQEVIASFVIFSCSRSLMLVIRISAFHALSKMWNISSSKKY